MEIKLKSRFEVINVLYDAGFRRISTAELSDILMGYFSSNVVDETMNIWHKEKENFFAFFLLIPKDVAVKILAAWDIAPYYNIVINYISFCHNSSPVVLKDISPAAWQIAEENNVDPYDNWKGWSVFWINAPEDVKDECLNYIERERREIAKTLPF